MALLVITILTVVPYFFLKSDARGELDRLQTEADKMQAGNARIERENEAMRARIDALRTNPRLIERQARERLHLARPDEVILVFEPTAEDGTGKEAAPGVGVQPRNPKTP